MEEDAARNGSGLWGLSVNRRVEKVIKRSEEES
jgi:hypothetical protein